MISLPDIPRDIQLDSYIGNLTNETLQILEQTILNLYEIL